MDIEIIKIDITKFSSMSDVIEFCAEHDINIFRLPVAYCGHNGFRYIYYDLNNDIPLFLSNYNKFEVINDTLNRKTHFIKYLKEPITIK